MRFSLSALIALLAAGVIGCGTEVGTEAGSSNYQVDLTWEAPASSSDPVVGYKVYRSAQGTGSYIVLNSTVLTELTYTDTTAADGQTYDYIVESVDAQGNLSLPSNTYTAVIP